MQSVNQIVKYFQKRIMADANHFRLILAYLKVNYLYYFQVEAITFKVSIPFC
jgi:hypothetical protein